VITEIKNNRVEKVEFKALTGNSKLLDDLFNYFKLTIERKEGLYFYWSEGGLKIYRDLWEK
jgi:hypothetical protein